MSCQPNYQPDHVIKTSISPFLYCNIQHKPSLSGRLLYFCLYYSPLPRPGLQRVLRLQPINYRLDSPVPSLPAPLIPSLLFSWKMHECSQRGGVFYTSTSRRQVLATSTAFYAVFRHSGETNKAALTDMSWFRHICVLLLMYIYMFPVVLDLYENTWLKCVL